MTAIQRLASSAALCAIALGLTACDTTRTAIRADTRAVAVTCAPQCSASCLPAQWPQWAGDPESPATWDELPPVAADIRKIAETCDAARKTCLACLSRIESAGVVCGITKGCN